LTVNISELSIIRIWLGLTFALLLVNKDAFNDFKRGFKMRSDFYEFRPFVGFAIGLIAMTFSVSSLMMIAGLIVVVGTSLIIYTRLRYRGIIR
jgi:hypothetical protein